MELYKQIKRYRTDMNLSQEELAEKIYVTRQTISNWENDKSYPDIHSLLLLSSTFHISLDQLIKGDITTMKEEISKEAIQKFNRDGAIFTVLLILTVIAAVPLAVFLGYCGYIVWGILFLIMIYYALRVEKFKKENDIMTYKEIVAFTEGKQLDEIEKAHPDVFNILLQVLDDGRITDSKGNTVSFKNTIIIMTSNIGSSYLLDGIHEDGSIKPEAEEMVMNDLRAHFRPEFLNRLDEIIMFKPLTKANIGNIVDLLIADVNKRLADKELKVELTPEAKEFVVSHGFDPTYGARPLKRYIQKTVETLAAKLILAGNISTGTILIDVDGDKLEARSKGEVQK